jgi:hypothetical protein
MMVQNENKSKLTEEKPLVRNLLPKQFYENN